LLHFHSFSGCLIADKLVQTNVVHHTESVTDFRGMANAKQQLGHEYTDLIHILPGSIPTRVANSDRCHPDSTMFGKARRVARFIQHKRWFIPEPGAEVIVAA